MLLSDNFLCVGPLCDICSQDDIYRFPPLEVCFWGGEGCDERLNESTCIESVIYSVYDTCGEEAKDMRIPNQVSSQRI